MIEVLYKRVPTEYINQSLSEEEIVYFEKERRGLLVHIGTESAYDTTGFLRLYTVCYVADLEDGYVSKISPMEIKYIGGIN